MRNCNRVPKETDVDSVVLNISFTNEELESCEDYFLEYIALIEDERGGGRAIEDIFLTPMEHFICGLMIEVGWQSPGSQNSIAIGESFFKVIDAEYGKRV